MLVTWDAWEAQAFDTEDEMALLGVTAEEYENAFLDSWWSAYPLGPMPWHEDV